MTIDRACLSHRQKKPCRQDMKTKQERAGNGHQLIGQRMQKEDSCVLQEPVVSGLAHKMPKSGRYIDGGQTSENKSNARRPRLSHATLHDCTLNVTKPKLPQPWSDLATTKKNKVTLTVITSNETQRRWGGRHHSREVRGSGGIALTGGQARVTSLLWKYGRLLIGLVQLPGQLRRHLRTPYPRAACVSDLVHRCQQAARGRRHRLRLTGWL